VIMSLFCGSWTGMGGSEGFLRSRVLYAGRTVFKFATYIQDQKAVVGGLIIRFSNMPPHGHTPR